MLKIIGSAFALVVAGCTAQVDTDAAYTEGVKAVAETLIDAAKRDEVGLQFVEDLTTEIGPRLAGSEAEARARDWAVGELKTLGFENVRVEDFEIPFWSRISESVEIARENPQKLVATALGGSRATPEGGIEAQIVRFESMA